MNLFGCEFKVIKEFRIIYKKIGDYEAFYAYEKDGKLEYEILDDLFGQPSPANWDRSSYAKLMRSIASDELEKLMNEGIIKLMGGN